MSGTARHVGAHRRALLLHGWQVCSAPPSLAAAPQPPEHADWIAAETLGPVAAVLQAAGRWSLDGPPQRFDATDWWYRLRFDLPEGFGHSELVLGFDGLATIGTVWLNGEPLLASSNMFVAHECAVAGRLCPHGNELLLHFASLDAALAARKPRPRWRAPMVEHQQLRWWRTTLLGRTPGWSPPCAVVGPWRDVWLEDRSGLRCELRHLSASLQGDDGVLTLSCAIDAPALSQVELSLQREGQRFAWPLLQGDDGCWHLNATVAQATPWWPHTHGEPALYEAQLNVRRGDASPFTVALGRIGFRRIELQRDNDDFALNVNGVSVFCRGACWMPVDAVALRGSPQELRRTLQRCRDAGMNMLRVVGPAVYEDDAFFDACDELGLLVWQDLMFANMDYPGDDAAFVESVNLEVAQQAARWQGRPSLALVCGNSEVSQQAAMWGAPRDAWLPPLFAQQLPQRLATLLPGVPYWPSSAWGGTFPHQVNAGSASYYGVGAYLRAESDARRSGLRFASECLGFSNVPEPDALARLPAGAAIRVTHAAWKARAPRDLGAGWDFEDVRDHYLALLFDIDPTKLRYADHERYLLLSRVTTGEVMARAFAEWRAAGSACRGALVWFLRDLWAGAGWGLLDDAGAPKACWHALQRVLQPRTVLLTDEGSNGLVAHLVNEHAQPLQAVLDVAAWRGDVATCRASRTLTLAPRSVQALPLMALLDHFADLNNAYRFGPLNHDAVVATLREPGGRRLGQAVHFPGGMNLPREGDLGLQAQASSGPDGSVQLRLSTRRLALGLHAEASGLHADDAYFHLVPGDEHLLTLRPTTAQARPWRCTLHALNLAAPISVRAPHAG